jgi:hypothetical protein
MHATSNRPDFPVKNAWDEGEMGTDACMLLGKAIGTYNASESFSF